MRKYLGANLPVSLHFASCFSELNEQDLLQVLQAANFYGPSDSLLAAVKDRVVLFELNFLRGQTGLYFLENLAEALV